MAKAYTRAAKRRAKKAKEPGPQKPFTATQAANTGATPRETARPTPERKRRGVWAKPTGADKHMHPMVDLAHDMIGALYAEGKLSHSQEQAARLFQELRAGFVAELGVTGYRSCLDDSRGGYDAGDGDAEAIRAYQGLANKIGRVKTALLTVETEKPGDGKPNDLAALRNALDCVAG